MEPMEREPGFAAAPPPSGLPWEAGETARTPTGALRTLSAVLLSPAQAFQAMRRTGGVGDPLLYLVLVGTVGLAFGLFWQMAVRGWLGSLGVPGELDGLALEEGVAVAMLLLTPLLLVIGAAVGTAIYHLMLLLLGGAPQPIETTFRVVCYASGSTYSLQIVPLCGGIIAMFWSLVAIIIGLREAQGVSTGRAAAAVLIPAALFCLCCALMWTTLLGMAMALPFLGEP